MVTEHTIKNYKEADIYRKHLTVEEKAALYDLICNAMIDEDKGFDIAHDKLEEDVKSGKVNEDDWNQEWSKRLDENRIDCFQQIRSIMRSALRPTNEELHISTGNGDLHPDEYRTVDMDETYDKLCNFLGSLFQSKFEWGRSIFDTHDDYGDYQLFIREVDTGFYFNFWTDEFTPYYDDFWHFIDSNIPRLLNNDKIELFYAGDWDMKKFMPNPIKGVKNAKELHDKLVELGF